MLLLSLSDETGLLNVVVPRAVRARDGDVLRREPLLWMRGVVERRGRARSVRALALRPLGGCW